MTTYYNAVNEMFAMFYDYWRAEASAIVGYTPAVWFQGKQVNSEGETKAPPTDKFWCRISEQPVLEGQSTLRDGNCGQTFETNGMLMIQLFCPKEESQAMEQGRQLAQIIRDAYRGKSSPGGVWFRNVTIRPLDPEPKWLKFNVIAEYQFNEHI